MPLTVRLISRDCMTPPPPLLLSWIASFATRPSIGWPLMRMLSKRKHLMMFYNLSLITSYAFQPNRCKSCDTRAWGAWLAASNSEHEHVDDISSNMHRRFFQVFTLLSMILSIFIFSFVSGWSSVDKTNDLADFTGSVHADGTFVKH